MGDYEQAVDAFTHCLQLDSFYAQAREKLVETYLKLGKKDDAIQQYEQLLKQKPSAGIYSSTGTLYYKQGDIERAIRYFDEAMKIAESQGINCESSGIAGLALMLQMKNGLPKNKKMLIINTGKTKIPYS